jgi:hypothetical protein
MVDPFKCSSASSHYDCFSPVVLKVTVNLDYLKLPGILVNFKMCLQPLEKQATVYYTYTTLC